MRYLSFLLLVLCAVVQGGRVIKPQVRPQVSRFRQFPYHVIIRTSESDTERFSGALITRNYILTAASPLVKLQKTGGDLHISYGALLMEHGNRRYPEPERQDVIVPMGDDVIIHEEFRPDYPTVDNIALIKLPFAVNISEHVTTVKLPTIADEFKDWVGTHVTIVGLGTRYRASRLAKAVNHYNTTVLANKECVKHYSTWERNLCTDATVKGSYCAGTMGSPITTFGDVPELIAVAMEPEGCAANTAIVHTQVAPYLYWIVMHTNYAPPESHEDISYSLDDLNLPINESKETSAVEEDETEEKE